MLQEGSHKDPAAEILFHVKAWTRMDPLERQEHVAKSHSFAAPEHAQGAGPVGKSSSPSSANGPPRPRAACPQDEVLADFSARKAGDFFVAVKDAWRDQRGFRLFEQMEGSAGAAGRRGARELRVVAREWYCSKELEPPGGFPPGRQRFAPATKAGRPLAFPASEVLPVEVVHRSAVFGRRTRHFVEVRDELGRFIEDVRPDELIVAGAIFDHEAR